MVESETEMMPGIDIRGGKHIRLYQGDHSPQTFYREDPMTAVLTWQSQGHGGSTLQIRMEQLPVSPEVSRRTRTRGKTEHSVPARFPNRN
jgi:hypothetical protein